MIAGSASKCTLSLKSLWISWQTCRSIWLVVNGQGTLPHVIIISVALLIVYLLLIICLGWGVDWNLGIGLLIVILLGVMLSLCANICKGFHWTTRFSLQVALTQSPIWNLIQILIHLAGIMLALRQILIILIHNLAQLCQSLIIRYTVPLGSCHRLHPADSRPLFHVLIFCVCTWLPIRAALFSCTHWFKIINLIITFIRKKFLI